MDKFDYILASGLYEVWLEEGNVGSQEDFKTWLSSGAAGTQGLQGARGSKGEKGEDGRSSYEIIKTQLPTLVKDEVDLIQKLGNVFQRNGADLGSGFASEGVGGETSTVIVPPSTGQSSQPGGIQVNPEDQNNLPTSSQVFLEVWDDAPTGYVIKNIASLAKGVGPFTFVDTGAPLLANGNSTDPDYVNSPFEVKSNGDIVVKDATKLATFFNSFAATPAVNSKLHYYNIKDKYGRLGKGVSVQNGYGYYGIVIQVKSATKLIFSALSYEFDILKNVNNGDWVGTVNASTKALLPITYTISSDLDILSINSTTGRITIKNKELMVPVNGEVAFTVTATNGVRTRTANCRFFLYNPVDTYIINFSIASDGRSILKSENSPVPLRPGENRFLDYGTAVDRNLNFTTLYTITKSNAEKQNLGTYNGQVFGKFSAQTSIQSLFPGDVPKNNGYQLSPYDEITEFKVILGYNYNDAVRTAWGRKPTRINGLEGSAQNVGPSTELILTNPL